MLATDIQQLLIDAPGAGSEDTGHRGQRRRRLGQACIDAFPLFPRATPWAHAVHRPDLHRLGHCRVVDSMCRISWRARCADRGRRKLELCRIHIRPQCRPARRWPASVPTPDPRARAALRPGELPQRSSGPYSLPQALAEAGAAMRPVRLRRSGDIRCWFGRLRRSPHRARRVLHPRRRAMRGLRSFASNLR
jgi:hypothetical protein